MFGRWINIMSLAAESQQVMGLRMCRMAVGDVGACDEARLMITEKVNAASDAAWRLMTGASHDSIVQDYRRLVQANARRLSVR